ncbi:MAG: hypothetical protein SLAVMIC_00324 [uncultured marine phage]|uniref:Uncharacterized protein n=1 Tax=uncultured marine phage TaxID=707152 RepID=A0A8D9CBD2_9VIRU|nr:MAG: hypothetical protein SLAVMIC_00324 [uncultured marine phage]
MIKDKENNEDYWVDENLNPKFDKDFQDSIDDQENFEMVHELKYIAYTEKNYEISKEELDNMQIFFRSMKDYDKLLCLARIITKNEKKKKNLEKLYSSDKDEKTLREKLYNIYNEDHNIGKFIDIHVDSDLKEFLDLKERDNKLEQLLNG